MQSHRIKVIDFIPRSFGMLFGSIVDLIRVSATFRNC